MLSLLTAAQMKAADRQAIERGTPSPVLMERAAKAALEQLETAFDTSLTLLLCGIGNNGGDGLAMARMLAKKSKRARVLFFVALTQHGRPDRSKMTLESAEQFAALPPEVEVIFPKSDRDLLQAFADASCVVDALFGNGHCLSIPRKRLLCSGIGRGNL